MTALHWAAKRGNFEICYILLKGRADVNSIDMVFKLNLDWKNSFIFSSKKKRHLNCETFTLLPSYSNILLIKPWSNKNFSYTPFLQEN